jgi:hypothetical protein
VNGSGPQRLVLGSEKGFPTDALVRQEYERYPEDEALLNRGPPGDAREVAKYRQALNSGAQGSHASGVDENQRSLPWDSSPKSAITSMPEITATMGDNRPKGVPPSAA